MFRILLSVLLEFKFTKLNQNKLVENTNTFGAFFHDFIYNPSFKSSFKSLNIIFISLNDLSFCHKL